MGEDGILSNLAGQGFFPHWSLGREKGVRGGIEVLFCHRSVVLRGFAALVGVFLF